MTQYEEILAGRQDGYVTSVCLQCVSSCGIKVKVEAGRAVAIDGNPLDPNSKGKLCAKGQAGIMQAYDPHRVKHPLERVGPRGSGQWRRISWEEALEKITVRLQKLQNLGQSEKLVFYSGRNMMAGYTTRFTHAFGSPNHFNHDSLCASTRQTACMETVGDGWPLPDLEHSRYIILLGSNRLEANLPFVAGAQRLVKALGNKAKLVVVDPRFNESAVKADEWLPIIPGTDGAFVMGLINVIITEELFDRDFMEKWAVGFEQFAREIVPQYTPEYASNICGIPVATIERIAHEFATTKPAVADSLRGVAAHENGLAASRAVLMLNALVGNIDEKGGLCFSTAKGLSAVDPVPAVPSQQKIDLTGTERFPLADSAQQQILPSIGAGEPYPIDTIIFYHSSPAYSMPEPEKQIEVIKDEGKVPFIVSIDPFMGETTALADIILPETTYLERHDLISWPFAFEFQSYFWLRKPVIKPVHEARETREVLRELALKIGGGMEEYFQDTVVEYMKKELEGTEANWEELLKNGVWVDQNPRQYRRYEANGFGTKSGKLQIYSENLAVHGFEPFPNYHPVKHHQDGAKRSQYPFKLITFKVNVHNQSRTANIPQLMEIMDQNYLEINSHDASKLGIRDAETVRVTSETGQITIPVKVTEKIVSGVVGISHHFGHTTYGDVARGKGVNPNWVIACKEEPVGALVAFNDTMVRIERL